MSYQYPYTYFSCPCTGNATVDSAVVTAQPDEEDAAEKTFDPRAPRSNYSLYPLEHLMWCEDCHDIRCPRCTVEEIICWYCPSCLFEVASGMVKSEGNRCTRNCFNCPVCTAPLTVNTLDAESGGMAGPWILACDYCSWTTRDINVYFEKPNNIFGQLAQAQSGRKTRPSASRSSSTKDPREEPSSPGPPPRDHEARFAAMRSFYSSQLSKTGATNPVLSPTGDINYNSPSSLARIMSLYTSAGTYGKKAQKQSPMRPCVTPHEGLLEHSYDADVAAISKLRGAGWEGTTNHEQRTAQPHNPRFTSDLSPVPTLLRTKRSRRCRACRHILVRPEAKVASTRYRIKLVAVNNVPSMTLTPLDTPSGTSSPLDLSTLPPSRPLQFLLTLKNPMFDAIRVTLATPASTPGRSGSAGSRVTILCPQFEVGSNTDVWDEALGGDSKRASRLGQALLSKGPEPGNRVAEAGKIWDRGKNWTTVVMELVCRRIQESEEPVEEDEDVLEIPVFVRLEYESDAGGEEAQGLGGGAGGDKDKKEKRELAYWCVLGVGKVARVSI